MELVRPVLKRLGWPHFRFDLNAAISSRLKTQEGAEKRNPKHVNSTFSELKHTRTQLHHSAINITEAIKINVAVPEPLKHPNETETACSYK